MSLWSQRMREWVDCFLGRHDDAYLAEKLARAVEARREGDYQSRKDVVDALREYRARNPRQS